MNNLASTVSPAALVTSWSALGVLCGWTMGAWTRRLLRTTAFTVQGCATCTALTGVLFAALAWRSGTSFALLTDSYVAAILIPLSAIDLAEYRLPSSVILPSHLLLTATFSVHAAATTNWNPTLRAALGSVALGLAFLLLAVISGGLGAGDVKLAALLGLALGWHSWTTLLTGAALGWITGGLAWVVFPSFRTNIEGADLALGPWLALGAVGALLTT